MTVTLRISSTSRNKICEKATVTTTELTTAVVKVLAAPQQRVS